MYAPHLETRLHDLVPEQVITVCTIDPYGALSARKGKTGLVTFSWRFSYKGKNDAETIGLWDKEGDVRTHVKTARGWTLRAAVKQAEAFAMEHENSFELGGFRAIQDHNTRVLQAECSSDGHSTLGDLMRDYADFIDAQGKASGYDIRNVVKKHLELKHPALFNKPAALCSRDDFILVLRTITDSNVFDRARKMRVYLRAAYQLALQAASQPMTPPHFQAYQVWSNPLNLVGAPAAPTREAKPIDALTQAQLRRYWQLLQPVEGFKGAVLRLHLLTGGQRVKQLAQLLTANIQEHSFAIIDRKGRGAIARLHKLPFTPLVREQLRLCQPTGRYALSTGDGTTHVDPETLTDWAQELVGNEIPGFRLKWVRSGVETLLSRFRVDEEIRGRLQSHGISGVQAKFYNADQFLEQKLECLQLLEDVLQGRVEHPTSKSDHAQELGELKAMVGQLLQQRTTV
jgi:hypothetical protein